MKYKIFSTLKVVIKFLKYIFFLKVGDGTTSVVVLASELLKEAEKLVSMRLHPQTIILGYRKATDIARETLTNSAKDNSNDPIVFKEDLLKVEFYYFNYWY